MSEDEDGRNRAREFRQSLHGGLELSPLTPKTGRAPGPGPSPLSSQPAQDTATSDSSMSLDKGDAAEDATEDAAADSSEDAPEVLHKGADESAPEVVPGERRTSRCDPELAENPFESEKYLVGIGAPGRADTAATDGAKQSLSLELDPAAAPKPKKDGFKRRKYILIGVGIGLGIIVAAVGIYILVHHLHQGSAGPARPAAESSPGPQQQQPATGLDEIRPNSRLAVTGWRDGTAFNIRLFFQDPDGNLRYSTYFSSNDDWSGSTRVSVPNVLSGTCMGATTIVADRPEHQIQYFWIDNATRLAGKYFRGDVTSSKVDEENVNGYPLPVDKASRIATYWPYVSVQDSNGTLRLVTSVQMDRGGPWTNRTLSVSASLGSGLAIVPLTAAFESPFDAGMLYRTREGKLGGWKLRYNQSGSQWDGPVGTGSIIIPESSPIAAFAVQHPGSDTNDVTALYQDTSTEIKFLTYRNRGWSQPATSQALVGADKGTDIACLTEAVWVGINPLMPETNMSRCYFQAGGKLREVLYDGKTWSVKGFIPLS